ncbi:MAG: hypothetical protein LCH46_08695 [Proteobacteria bacterium]|nr:hypothetical protein [Pseudomonadota bacterium]
MAIRRQDFYEGAAIFQLLKTNLVERVTHAPPFFIINDQVAILLKYSTSKDSPWNFSFTTTELSELNHKNGKFRHFVGLICGSDGIVSLSLDQLSWLVKNRNKTTRIGCYRKHDQYYQINGPSGTLRNKISRLAWIRILESSQANDEAF